MELVEGVLREKVHALKKTHCAADVTMLTTTASHAGLTRPRHDLDATSSLHLQGRLGGVNNKKLKIIF